MKRNRPPTPIYSQTVIDKMRSRVIESCTCCGHVLKTVSELMTEDELKEEIRMRRVELTDALERVLKEEGIQDYSITYYQNQWIGTTMQIRAQAMHKKTHQPILLNADQP